MRKLVLLGMCIALSFSSCVSKKKYTDLEAKQRETQDLLNSATVKLNSCLAEEAAAQARLEGLREQVADLRKSNDNLQVLSAKGASNVEKTLESLKEKDMKISRLQDALNKKDSVTLALVTSLKKEVGINDPDIQVNVEKGVVIISLADKLLFKTGSYTVSKRAKEVLGKVATVVNGKPTFECMVESHTDNVPYRKDPLLDNWDLSVKRATSVVRVLEELGVQSSRLIAAGRGEFQPLVPNDTAENRAANRRTKVYVLPKIDEFYEMIEEEMKVLAKE